MPMIFFLLKHAEDILLLHPLLSRSRRNTNTTISQTVNNNAAAPVFHPTNQSVQQQSPGQNSIQSSSNHHPVAVGGE